MFNQPYKHFLWVQLSVNAVGGGKLLHPLKLRGKLIWPLEGRGRGLQLFTVHLKYTQVYGVV